MIDDCDNVMVRDALPDLAAGVIAAADAAAMQAHVDDCESCRGELLLIRTLRDSRGQVRSIDVAAIVRALPAPPRRATDVVDIATRRRARAIPMQWRAAAAALVVAAGTLGIAVTRHAPTAAPVATPAAVTVASLPSAPPVAAEAPRSAVVASAPSVGTRAPATAAPSAGAQLLVAGAAHDLASAQQKQLLRELDAYDGLLQEDAESAAYDFGESGL